MPRYKTIDGTPIRLRDEIGSGGEGGVYELDGDIQRVAKIWHMERRVDERIVKVSKMCRMDVTLRINDDPVLAWPEELIFEHRSVVGYVMPKVNNYFTLFDCLTPFRRRQNNLSIGPDDIPVLASRIASIFAVLHANKCYVGDINPQNILIRRNSLTPIFIDCDSFQINDPEYPDVPFLSQVGTQEYIAPERAATNSPIDASMDVFGLAVIVYQLLMGGVHPFAGIDVQVENIPSLAGRIADGRFAHCWDGRWRPRNDKIESGFSALPQDVMMLFSSSFLKSIRPSAQNFRDVLNANKIALANVYRRYIES